MELRVKQRTCSSLLEASSELRRYATAVCRCMNSESRAKVVEQKHETDTRRRLLVGVAVGQICALLVATMGATSTQLAKQVELHCLTPAVFVESASCKLHAGYSATAL